MPAIYKYMYKEKESREELEKLVDKAMQELGGEEGITRYAPYGCRQDVLLRRALPKICDSYLRPSEQELLLRLLRGEGSWVDARALVYVLCPQDLWKDEDMAIHYFKLRPALSRIRKAIRSAGYSIESQRRSEDNRRLNTHFRISSLNKLTLSI